MRFLSPHFASFISPFEIHSQDISEIYISETKLLEVIMRQTTNNITELISHEDFQK